MMRYIFKTKADNQYVTYILSEHYKKKIEDKISLF